MTAQRILDVSPSVVHVVPLTTTVKALGSEVIIEPGSEHGLAARSDAQCQHVRSVSPVRVRATRGNVGAVALTQIRETIAVILDLQS